MLDQVRGYPLGRGLPRHLYYVRGHLDGEKKKKDQRDARADRLGEVG